MLAFRTAMRRHSAINASCGCKPVSSSLEAAKNRYQGSGKPMARYSPFRRQSSAALEVGPFASKTRSCEQTAASIIGHVYMALLGVA